MPETPETVAIRDQHLITRIAREQAKRRDKRTVQTAETLLTEYLTLLEHGLLPSRDRDTAPRPEHSAA